MQYIAHYITWHYTRALRDGTRIWMTMVWFWFHVFPVRLHLRSLLSRFERISEPYPDGFHPARIGASMSINVLMRIVGAVVRLIMVFIAVTLVLLTVPVAIVWAVTWLVLPVLVPALPVFALLLIIS